MRRPPWSPGLLALVLLLPGCGSAPSGPSGSPSPPPTTVAAAPVVGGRYLLSVQAGPGCGLPRGVLSFPVNVSTAGASPKPGLQATVEGEPSLLEAEFLVLDGTLRGGLGTTEKGAVANEARRVWLHTIASGPVTRSADGRGEIASGTLMGYLALGNPDDDEGALGTCDAGDHTFSLRSR